MTFVWDRTLSYLTDGFGRYDSALIACTLVSSRISSLARRHIYKYIHLGPVILDDSSGELRRELLIRTLLESTYDYGSLIHCLEIIGYLADLTDMAPYLANLKVLRLLPYPDSVFLTTIPSYPDPILLTLRDLVSRPRFIALDIISYSFQGGAMDLEYVLEGANNLKHLGLQLSSTSYAPHCMCRGMGYPPPPRQARPIPLESLSLHVSYNKQKKTVINNSMAQPAAITWLLRDDCMVYVGKLKRLKLTGNPAYININDLMKRCMPNVEVLEMTEHDYEDETVEEGMKSLGMEHFVNQRNILDQWIRFATFPKLKNISLVTDPWKANSGSLRGCSILGILWLQSILISIDTVAPHLQRLSINLNGNFNIPSRAPSKRQQLEMIPESPGNHIVNFNNDPDRWIHQMWHGILGNSGIKRCSKLFMLHIMLSQNYNENEMQECEAQKQCAMFVGKTRHFAYLCSGLPVERVAVFMRDRFGFGYTNWTPRVKSSIVTRR